MKVLEQGLTDSDNTRLVHLSQVCNSRSDWIRPLQPKKDPGPLPNLHPGQSVPVSPIFSALLDFCVLSFFFFFLVSCCHVQYCLICLYVLPYQSISRNTADNSFLHPVSTSYIALASLVLASDHHTEYHTSSWYRYRQIQKIRTARPAESCCLLPFFFASDFFSCRPFCIVTSFLRSSFLLLSLFFLPVSLSAVVDYFHGIQSICNPSKIGGLCGFLPASLLSHCLLEYASWSVRCSVKLYINFFFLSSSCSLALNNPLSSSIAPTLCSTSSQLPATFLSKKETTNNGHRPPPSRVKY